MTPSRYRVADRHPQTADVVTLELEPCEQALDAWQPGQFTMVYAFGVGEVPISVSGGTGERIEHTVRAVGAVTRAVCAAQPGTELGLRGPFGHGWVLPDGGDLVIVGGGIGLAPLRPVILTALADRDRFGAVDVYIGARTPADLLFTGEYAGWQARGVRVHVTVDRADTGWSGHVGVVTTLFDRAGHTGATAFVCGPEVMMRFAARDLTGRVPAHRIQVSMERNMRCGYGVCGHCQLDEMIICRDGPVTGYDRAQPLMAVPEL
jgi:NAD(P)H-flavin reductase